MFSSVQFLFLLSLGVFSWAILCYFTQIEKYLMSPNNSEELSIDTFMTGGEATTQGFSLTPYRDDYDLYVNFLCIFACMYALAKVADMAERYMAREMYSKLNIPTMHAIDFHVLRVEGGEFTPQKTYQNLLSKIHKLQKQNLELKLKLHEANVGSLKANVNQQFGDGDINNIYISNRHFRLNHNVYINKDNTSIQFENFSDKAGDSNEIWQKYLDIQKQSLMKRAQIETYVPVVMSSEQLQNINGGLAN